MKKVLLRGLIYLTHLVTNILAQDMLTTMLIWYYDTTIDWFIIYTVISLISLIADYIINGKVLCKAIGKSRLKGWLHLPDLVFAVPNVGIAIFSIIQMSLGIDNLSGTLITVNIIVLVTNALLVAERILLIRKSDLYL